MSLPILNATNPTVIPAKTYDRIWIEEVNIKAPNPNGDIAGAVKLHRYGMFDGVAEFDPDGGQWIIVEDMLQKAQEDADLNNAMISLVAYITKVGVQDNIISS